jgi:DNA-3-methyladenine glycosylase
VTAGVSEDVALTPVPFPREFYEPSAGIVAPALLGHWLVRRTTDGLVGGRIVETEAYLSFDDPACHAAKGKTIRNAAMWGAPGRAYVYFNLRSFNAVCRPEGIAEAVLVRAVEADLGLAFMRARRGAKGLSDLTNGPGKCCAALDIGRSLDGADLCRGDSPVFIGMDPDVETFRNARGPVRCGPRIGLSRATDLPLRFYLDGSRFVSRR